MKIHHLNCGAFRSFGGNALIGNAKPFEWAEGVVHCLLIETDDGLLLVDTGFGLGDCLHPTRFMRWMIALSGFSRDPAEIAFQQIHSLGYDPSDVRHIAITHFHYDHVGALPDFPEATVHIYEREYEAALNPRGISERYPYRREHWAHGPRWCAHALCREEWFGFPCTSLMDLGGVRFCFVPLVGHTRGHSAVAVQAQDAWLLHCGDAYTYHGQVHPTRPRRPDYAYITLPLIQLNKSFRVIGSHTSRLRQLLWENGDQVLLTCSHDAVEFERYSSMECSTLISLQVDQIKRGAQ